jgi:hypothetical protein
MLGDPVKLRRFLACAGTMTMLAAGATWSTVSSASAYAASNCGVTAAPILVSHPVTIDDSALGNLGVIYLGYFSDCRGVYAEIHWDSPEGESCNSDPYNPVCVSYLDARVSGRIYIDDENHSAFGYVSFDKVADGTYTTSVVEQIDRDPWGTAYAPPKLFTPAVTLTVSQQDQAGGLTQQLCGPRTLVGNTHSFSSGGWGSGASAGC